MLTFAVLVVTTFVLAAVGMLALINTRAAVQGFDEEILPSVAKSLALAERVAHLAASAPYVTEATIPSKLTQERAELQLRQNEVEQLAKELPLARESTSGMPQLLASLKDSIAALIETKRQDLFHREDARAQLYALGQLQRDAEANELSMARRQRIDVLVLTLQAALSAANEEDLESLRQNYAQRERAAGGDLPTSIASHAQSIFLLRARQLESEDRKVFLLASIRFLSDELTAAVNRHVSTISADVASRRDLVGVAARSGLTAVAATFLVACIALAIGFLTLRGALQGLGKVTSSMTSLAEGSDRSEPLESGRGREIDALIDAFEVFRANSLEMRRMAQDIAEKKTLLQTVFDNINDGLSVFDAEGRLVTWNPQYVALLRLPQEAVREGVPISELQKKMPPLAQEAPDLSGFEALNWPRQLHALDVDLQFQDGRVLSIRSQPMPDGGFVTLYNDTSERRALELQVRQTQKMDVLGQLTGGVAHDFNNLLAAIISNLQLLQGQPDLPEAAQRFARRALQASERGASLTMRLLAFARRQPLQRESLEVDRILEDLRELLEHSVGHGVSVKLDLQAGGTHVFVDGGQLENAILNLALNGAAAMPRGGVLEIRTRLPVQQNAVDRVEITVSDTGHGMPQHVLERIFEPFFSTRKSEGSGLGLSIIYGFIRQSGGDIQAQSVADVGTSFHITLPVATAQPTRADKPLGTVRPLDGLLTLLVDDDVDVRESTRDLLEMQGAEVVAVETAATALMLLREERFDVLLSDVGLGTDEDGLSLMREVERLCPNLPILLMSGLPSDLLARRYGVPPATRVLRKPFMDWELTEAVRSVLSVRG